MYRLPITMTDPIPELGNRPLISSGLVEIHKSKRPMRKSGNALLRDVERRCAEAKEEEDEEEDNEIKLSRGSHNRRNPLLADAERRARAARK